jgi:hypothetical protein
MQNVSETGCFLSSGEEKKTPTLLSLLERTAITGNPCILVVYMTRVVQ